MDYKLDRSTCTANFITESMTRLWDFTGNLAYEQPRVDPVINQGAENWKDRKHTNIKRMDRGRLQLKEPGGRDWKVELILNILSSVLWGNPMTLIYRSIFTSCLDVWFMGSKAETVGSHVRCRCRPTPKFQVQCCLSLCGRDVTSTTPRFHPQSILIPACWLSPGKWTAGDGEGNATVHAFLSQRC